MSTAIDQIAIFNDVPLCQLLFKDMKKYEKKDNTELPSFEDEIFHIENILRLSLVNVRMRVIDATCMQFVNLTYLNLSFNRISEVNSISRLINLKLLDISHNKIFDLNPIKNMLSLKILRFESNLIESLKPISFLVNLKQLFLGDNNVIWEELVYIENLNNLEMINLGKNPLNQKAKLFDFLCAFRYSLKLIYGMKYDTNSVRIKNSNDKYKYGNIEKENKLFDINDDICKEPNPTIDINLDSVFYNNDDITNSRKSDFFRTSDGKLMATRARAYFIKNDDKNEIKNEIKDEIKSRNDRSTSSLIDDNSLTEAISNSSSEVRTFLTNKSQTPTFLINEKNRNKRISLSCGSSREENLKSFLESELLMKTKQKILLFESDHQNLFKSNLHIDKDDSLSIRECSSASALDNIGSTIRFGGDNLDKNAPIAFFSENPCYGFVK